MAENRTLERRNLEAAYRVFQRFALEDQRAYYEQAVRRYRKAAEQVNRIRAALSLLTGIAAALAGLLMVAFLVSGAFANGGECARLASSDALVQGVPTAGDTPSGAEAARPGYCGVLEAVVISLTVVSIVAPAIGAGFTTLADLYQWDRLVSIYDTALENLEVADAESPYDDMTDLEYKASLRAYAEGALGIMRDEAAQWGLTARAPQQLEKFLDEEREKARRLGGSADDLIPGRTQPPVEPPATPSGG